MKKRISIIVPVYNEEKNIPVFFSETQKIVEPLPYDYEYIFVNDGSRDETARELARLARTYPNVRNLELSRNFGKEIATTAGLHHAQGDAALIIDADLQHPVHLIPEFIQKWEAGSDVVVGMRQNNMSDGMLKKCGSYLFYTIMTLISETEMQPGATDYRLLDRIVIDEFNKFTERSRITRGLIDWLGFKREYIYFQAHERKHGKANYSMAKLIRLAIASFVSHSLLPLRLAGYLGGIIVLGSGILGIIMLLDRYVFPWGFAFSGPAILADLILFLVGIVLISIGILAVYIGNIHLEVHNRPLYVIRKR